jgi:phosphoribosylpyrophosphate synthetase
VRYVLHAVKAPFGTRIFSISCVSTVRRNDIERNQCYLYETMALAETLVAILTHIGSGAGTVGGGLAVTIYRRFQSAEQAALSAEKLAKALELKIIATTADLTAIRTFVSNEVDGLKTAVGNQIAAIARGSKAEITVSPDQKTLERLTALETRMSAVEDDIDKKDDEDRKAWDEILRSIGRIEGQLISSKRHP